MDSHARVPGLVISPYAKLDGYRLVVAPDLNVLPEDMAQHLLEYVRGGGHLVLGPRAGMKDQFNALLPQRQPGYLVDALGGRVDRHEHIGEGTIGADAFRRLLHDKRFAHAAFIAETPVDSPGDEARNVGVLRTLAAG